MQKILLLILVPIFIFTACKPSDDPITSAEIEEKTLGEAIEGGYPYDFEDRDVINDYADKVTDTVSNPFVGVEERLKLAIELDAFQHPSLPPIIFPEVTAQVAHVAFSEAKRLSDLSLKYYQLGEIDKAVSFSEQVIQESEKVLGPDSENLLVYLSNLGFFYTENEQLDEAEETYQRGVNIVQNRHGSDYKVSLHYATASEPLMEFYVAQSKYEEAKPIAEQILTTYGKYLGPDHYKNGIALVKLGEIYHSESNVKKAEDSFLQAIDIYKNSGDKSEEIVELHVEALEALSFFYEVDFYMKTQNSEEDFEHIWDKSLKTLDHAKNIAVVFLGEDHPYTQRLQAGLSIQSP